MEEAANLMVYSKEEFVPSRGTNNEGSEEKSKI